MAGKLANGSREFWNKLGTRKGPISSCLYPFVLIWRKTSKITMEHECSMNSKTVYMPSPCV